MDELSASAYCPGTHAMQVEAFVAPITPLEVPMVQLMHVGEPSASANRPGTHAMQVDASVAPIAVLDVPAAQAMQSNRCVIPSVVP